jgi:hypothetical protein
VSYALIAEAADKRAEFFEGLVRINLSQVGSMAGKMGYTPLEMGFGSSRAHVGEAQSHYRREAARFEELAAKWRRRAEEARLGVIVPDPDDGEWKAILGPQATRWGRPSGATAEV